MCLRKFLDTISSSSVLDFCCLCVVSLLIISFNGISGRESFFRSSSMEAISGGGVGGGGGIRKKWECLINITKYTRSQACSHSVISSRPGGRGFFSDKSNNSDKGVTLLEGCMTAHLPHEIK